MKRILTILILAFILPACILAGCGGPDDAAVASGPASSVPSAVSKKESSSSKSSKPMPADEDSKDQNSKKEESRQESKKEESSKESSKQQDNINILQLEEEDLGSIIPETKMEVNDLRLTMNKEFPYNKSLGVSYADMWLYGPADELLKLINELCKCEKDNLYIEYFEFNVVDGTYLYLDYDDEESDRTRYYNVRIRLTNPYIKGDIDESSAKKYIKEHWNRINKSKFFDALIKEHNHYYYTMLKGSLMPDKDKKVTVNASLDFATYTGFVTYKYKLNESGNFIPDEKAAINARKKSDIPLPYHADIGLTVDGFKK